MTAYTKNVNGSDFHWDMEKGEFHFENDEVVLFWVNTAFKTLLDSIEEIAGENEAKLVLETAGYRTGKTVSQFYSNTLGEPEEILKKLPNTYLTAGWGKTDIISVSFEDKQAVIRVQNGWEYKVNTAQKKDHEGTFLPGHWAGVFSGLFGETVWYEVTKSQIEGDQFSEYRFFPSSVTPSLNVSTLIQEQKKAAQEEIENVTRERTEFLSEMIKEISSPIIPVMESILVVPLVGRYNELRAEELLDRTLLNLPLYKATHLIVDLTSLKGVDDYTLSFIDKFIHATAILGTKCILVGISAELSMQITNRGHKINRVPCYSMLQNGVMHALDELGLKLTKK
ncbi:STAS domain-containing protein [Rossellomorea vietnamensis]|uniref:STAS domain-containing protein n=1 Tax=Rossellomorea vietnamensis TaxID=218284 RepID=A0A5D4K985_9BACI|nr:STAS domain-containing protein [Rossellomorea vietnamensis]TYR73944.1 STAS domain-containing protein [Rossellomorea vietnamensis]